mgnify:CR=1 FL=1
MQLYHRYLKLPFNFEKPTLYDSIELKDYCEFIYFKDEDLKTEPILDFIDSIGLYRIQTNSVYSAPKDGIRIHSDTPDLSDKVKLSFSWGSPDSKTIWWEPKDYRRVKVVNFYESHMTRGVKASKIKMATIPERIRLFLKGKKIGPLTKYAWAKEKDCNKVLERTIDRPSLYNVGRLHSTWNPSSEGRWTLTFILGKKRDKKPLHFIESLNYFRDYIVDDNYRN